MRTLILQHTPEEVPGTLEDWLKLRGFPYHVHHMYKDGPIPSGFEWLVILGGPMNVDEEEKHPWLRAEKAFLRDWLKTGKPMLGICLGGQMLAQALGGKVTKNTQREIGFHPVKKTGAKHPAFAHWPERLEVFQWHEDCFSLPPGCENLLTNEVAPHQAFARDRHTVGFQFHPESTRAWIELNYQSFQPPGNEPFVQSAAVCLPQIPQKLDPMRERFFGFLDDFVKAD